MPDHDHQHCLKVALKQAQQLCEAKGLRLTPIREKVLSLIWQSHRPSKAYDILEKLGTASHSAKPPTVYRALDFLLEHRLVHRLHTLNAYIGCAHPNINDAAAHECYFLICRECGELSEYCDTRLKQHISTALEEQHFFATRSNIEIEGLCQQCQPSNAT